MKLQKPKINIYTHTLLIVSSCVMQTSLPRTLPVIFIILQMCFSCFPAEGVQKEPLQNVPLATLLCGLFCTDNNEDLKDLGKGLFLPVNCL